MKTYQLSAPVHAETSTTMFGLIAGDFDAGVVTPVNEQDELLLEHLVSIGVASIIDDEPKSRPRGKQEA